MQVPHAEERSSLRSWAGQTFKIKASVCKAQAHKLQAEIPTGLWIYRYLQVTVQVWIQNWGVGCFSLPRNSRHCMAKLKVGSKGLQDCPEPYTWERRSPGSVRVVTTWFILLSWNILWQLANRIVSRWWWKKQTAVPLWNARWESHWNSLWKDIPKPHNLLMKTVKEKSRKKEQTMFSRRFHNSGNCNLHQALGLRTVIPTPGDLSKTQKLSLKSSARMHKVE